MTKTRTSPDITPQQRLTIVKHLANGRGLDFTAAATGFTADQVRDVGSEHGWPREASLAEAADVLTKNLDRDARAQITPRPDLEVSQRNRPSGQTLRESRNENPVTGIKNLDSRPSDDGQMTEQASRVGNLPTPANAPQMRSGASNQASKPLAHQHSGGNCGSLHARQFDATAALLLRGRESPKKRTQALAQKISDSLSDLRDRLDDEDRERREAERAAEAAAEARAEVERLERELREAKARARRHNKGYSPTQTVRPRTEPVQPVSRRGLSPGDFTCPEPGCGRHFTSAQGLGGHKARAHRIAS